MPFLLIDGNNLGHVLGYINRDANRYNQADLLARLDQVACYLSAHGQTVDMLVFFDDPTAAERLGGRYVQIAPAPSGDADAAIRAFAETHADHLQILVSGDRNLCGDVSLWGVVCLSPETFVAHYITLAHQADRADAFEKEAPPVASKPLASLTRPDFQGITERQRQAAALARAEAILRGEALPPPDVFRLDLNRWTDDAELALYLAENHLCPDHPDLTTPPEIIAAIRVHCCRQPRYFTSGHIIDRLFRLFLCRPEHTLTLDDLTRQSHTRRRRKVRAALQKHGGRLGIQVAW